MKRLSIHKFEKEIFEKRSRSDEERFKILVAIQRMFLLQNRKVDDEVLETITVSVIEQGYEVAEVDDAVGEIVKQKVYDLNLATIVEQIDKNRKRNERLEAAIKAKIEQNEYDYISMRVRQLVEEKRPFYEERIKELARLTNELGDIDIEAKIEYTKLSIATKKAENR
jgi:hypothetical protein